MSIDRGSRRTGDLERGKIVEVLAVHASAAEDIYDVVDEGGRVALACGGNEADASELRPYPRRDVEHPGVVVMKLAIGTAKTTEC